MERSKVCLPLSLPAKGLFVDLGSHHSDDGVQQRIARGFDATHRSEG